MTALTAQAFLDQGYDDYGNGSTKAKGFGKGKQAPKRNDCQDSWKPEMGNKRSTSSYQGWAQKQGGWSDYQGSQKGGQKGNQKGQAKGAWKERDHDSRTKWKKDDDQDNHDSWGSGWKSWAPSRTHATPLFGCSSLNQARPQDNKGQGKAKIQPAFICALCSCAFVLIELIARIIPLPPGFMWKDTVPWQSLICPCINSSQHLCNKPLSHAQDCSFCQEHLKHWSSKQAQDSCTSIPTPTKCMISQLDRILFDLDPIMQAPAVTTDATILRKVPSTLTTLHSSMLRNCIPYPLQQTPPGK